MGHSESDIKKLFPEATVKSGVLNYYESEHEGLDISSLFLVLRQSR